MRSTRWIVPEERHNLMNDSNYGQHVFWALGGRHYQRSQLRPKGHCDASSTALAQP